MSDDNLKIAQNAPSPYLGGADGDGGHDSLPERVARMEAKMEHVATKTDIANVETKIANLETKVSTDIADLKTDIANVKVWILGGAIGAVLSLAVIVATLIRFFPA